MDRLIVTSTGSGAGSLKAARIADKVIGFDHDLLCGCVPLVEEPIQFFETRKSLWPNDAVDRFFDEHAAETWADLGVAIDSAERVELWIDPDPNSQLKLLQLLASIASGSQWVGKTNLFQLDVRLGELPPEVSRRIKPTLAPITSHNTNLARTGWHAFRQPTPEAWWRLKDRDDLTELPMLRDAVLRVLQELPDSQSGLSLTQKKILSLIADGATSPLDVYSDVSMNFGNSVFGYWRHAEMLEELARCEVPAVSGLPQDVFSYELHDDASRLRRYQRSAISLTDFGVALLVGKNDFAAHNRIDRWWGGTRLTNQTLWRWDESSGVLVSP